ncbi:MAG: hypothetical protein MHMPM18_001555 [Marteilia pararefringens]
MAHTSTLPVLVRKVMCLWRIKILNSIPDSEKLLQNHYIKHFSRQFSMTDRHLSKANSRSRTALNDQFQSSNTTNATSSAAAAIDENKAKKEQHVMISDEELGRRSSGGNFNRPPMFRVASSAADNKLMGSASSDPNVDSLLQDLELDSIKLNSGFEDKRLLASTSREEYDESEYTVTADSKSFSNVEKQFAAKMSREICKADHDKEDEFTDDEDLVPSESKNSRIKSNKFHTSSIAEVRNLQNFRNAPSHQLNIKYGSNRSQNVRSGSAKYSDANNQRQSRDSSNQSSLSSKHKANRSDKKTTNKDYAKNSSNTTQRNARQSDFQKGLENKTIHENPYEQNKSMYPTGSKGNKSLSSNSLTQSNKSDTLHSTQNSVTYRTSRDIKSDNIGQAEAKTDRTVHFDLPKFDSQELVSLENEIRQLKLEKGKKYQEKPDVESEKAASNNEIADSAAQTSISPTQPQQASQIVYQNALPNNAVYAQPGQAQAPFYLIPVPNNPNVFYQPPHPQYIVNPAYMHGSLVNYDQYPPIQTSPMYYNNYMPNYGPVMHGGINRTKYANSRSNSSNGFNNYNNNYPMGHRSAGNMKSRQFNRNINWSSNYNYYNKPRYESTQAMRQYNLPINHNNPNNFSQSQDNVHFDNPPNSSTNGPDINSKNYEMSASK